MEGTWLKFEISSSSKPTPLPLTSLTCGFLKHPRKEVLPEEEVFDWVWGPPQETSQIEYDRLPKPHQTPVPQIENIHQIMKTFSGFHQLLKPFIKNGFQGFQAHKIICHDFHCMACYSYCTIPLNLLLKWVADMIKWVLTQVFLSASWGSRQKIFSAKL